MTNKDSLIPAGWLPIKTAPRDGTAIKALIPGHHPDFVIHWGGPFVDDNEDQCWAWVSVFEYGWPATWDDGVCWAVNAALEPSDLPVAWRPVC